MPIGCRSQLFRKRDARVMPRNAMVGIDIRWTSGRSEVAIDCRLRSVAPTTTTMRISFTDTSEGSSSSNQRVRRKGFGGGGGGKGGGGGGFSGGGGSKGGGSGSTGRSSSYPYGSRSSGRQASGLRSGSGYNTWSYGFYRECNGSTAVVGAPLIVRIASQPALASAAPMSTPTIIPVNATPSPSFRPTARNGHMRRAIAANRNRFDQHTARCAVQNSTPQPTGIQSRAGHR